jgi:CDP-diacylglycerol--serine O-phosphatidyltransferase
MNREEIKASWQRRKYLVPNAVTVGNVFCGFLAIIYGASGRFDKAAIAIIIAILLDGLDGRVARRLKATSKFGVEFDSFSDLISFGVAPALLVYHWCFRVPADEFGVIVAFIYCVCAATRLARFNIMPPDTKRFVGLPTPGAAALVASIVHFTPEELHSWGGVAFSSCVLLALAYLMVSRIEFFSIKELKITGIRRFAKVVIAAMIALLWYSSQVGLLVISASYALSGPLMWIFGIGSEAKPAKAKPASEAQASTKEYLQ